MNIKGTSYLLKVLYIFSTIEWNEQIIYLLGNVIGSRANNVRYYITIT